MTHQIDISLININVRCEYLENQSAPDDAYFAFSYHVHIQNNSEQIIQLLNRSWVITDANGQTREIQGDGVIGKQPIIQPTQFHAYNSWSVIHTPVGCMHGKYGFRLVKNETTSNEVDFYADIPVFTLAVPGTLN